MGRAFEFRKARKFKRWAAMAKTFTRIGKDIVMAVKEGGPHPETNARLRAIMQNAKAANMPKENVERAIKRATEKDTAMASSPTLTWSATTWACERSMTISWRNAPCTCGVRMALP